MPKNKNNLLKIWRIGEESKRNTQPSMLAFQRKSPLIGLDVAHPSTPRCSALFTQGRELSETETQTISADVEYWQSKRKSYMDEEEILRIKW